MKNTSVFPLPVSNMVINMALVFAQLSKHHRSVPFRLFKCDQVGKK